MSGTKLVQSSGPMWRPKFLTHCPGFGPEVIQKRQFSSFQADTINPVQFDKSDLPRMWSKLGENDTSDLQTMLNVLKFNNSIIIFKHKGRAVYSY